MMYCAQQARSITAMHPAAVMPDNASLFVGIVGGESPKRPAGLSRDDDAFFYSNDGLKDRDATPPRGGS